MEAILLFDGYCVLCNKAADYLLEKDKEKRIKLAALQSEEGKKLARELRIPVGHIDSVILLEAQGWLAYHQAALRTLEILGRYRWLRVLANLIPQFIQKSLYKFIAKNRYGWFGRKSVCRLPSQEEKAHFASQEEVETLIKNYQSHKQEEANA